MEADDGRCCCLYAQLPAERLYQQRLHPRERLTAIGCGAEEPVCRIAPASRDAARQVFPCDRGADRPVDELPPRDSGSGQPRRVDRAGRDWQRGERGGRKQQRSATGKGQPSTGEGKRRERQQERRWTQETERELQGVEEGERIPERSGGRGREQHQEDGTSQPK
ncbi:MAG: hypothetical protein KatS3mg061_0214 [Dehalococcoidia bacterium]|nr:MAG: hypothetical protein KatS3mg061_0214 [Dehalococcoidia bacterium]